MYQKRATVQTIDNFKKYDFVGALIRLFFGGGYLLEDLLLFGQLFTVALHLLSGFRRYYLS